MMWSGLSQDIPYGWVLCDGRAINNVEVPDLRGKFIRGVRLSDIGNTGGTNSQSITSGAHDHTGGFHEHVVDDDGHTHTTSLESSYYNASKTSSSTGLTSTETTTTPATSKLIRGEGSGNRYDQPVSHSHNYSSLHNHNYSQTNGNKQNTYSNGTSFQSHHIQHQSTQGSHEHDGGSHTHNWENEPEHYVLAFIIKVSNI